MTAGAPREVTITRLELTGLAALRPAPAVAGVEIERVLDPRLNRWFYETIGRRWRWTDRLPWTGEQWAAYAAGVETWQALAGGRRAGYAELRAHERHAEIAMFGLLDEFHGRGIGGHLLTFALSRAWELPPAGAERVLVSTCTLDGPHALANYEARGMTRIARATVHA